MVIEALRLSLSVGRGLNEFDQGIESLPAPITLLKRNTRDKDIMKKFIIYLFYLYF